MHAYYVEMPRILISGRDFQFTSPVEFLEISQFLAHRDECPESYCRTPGVGVRVSVRVRVHKNFNLAHNS